MTILMNQCLDQGDSVGFAALSTSEASFVVKNARLTYKGNSSIKDLCTESASPCMHFESNIVLTPGNTGIINNRSYWQALNEGKVSAAAAVSLFSAAGGRVRRRQRWRCRLSPSRRAALGRRPCLGPAGL